MASINYNAKEINCVVVYFGAEGAGKASSMKHVHRTARRDTTGRLFDTDSTQGRVLQFDFIHERVGTLRTMPFRVHLHRAGHAAVDIRGLPLLKMADGVVFVADSRVDAMQANLVSLERLTSLIQEHHPRGPKLPIAFQLNHRDSANARSVEEMNQSLNASAEPCFESDARNGSGVLEALHSVVNRIRRQLMS